MNLIKFQNYPSTETPLNAENLNHNFNELNKANTYSTEEQVIGTWIDGKKIYRKVVTGIITTANTKINLAHDNIINISGKILGNNGGNNELIYYYDNTNYSYVYSQNYSTLMLLTVESNLNKNYYAIIEYTKTTE